MGRPATLFALALIDASIIGAAAVLLASAYALGMLSVKHSLHPGRRTRAGSIWCIAADRGGRGVGADPGGAAWVITKVVQTSAGVLLPSATVFLLLLCNDRAVLGPRVSGRWTNLCTGAVLAGLMMLPIVLTASGLYPAISGAQILFMLGGGTVVAVIAAGVTLALRAPATMPPVDKALRPIWRMRPLTQLLPAKLTGATGVWMIVLRGYLLLAIGLMVVRVVQLALGG